MKIISSLKKESIIMLICVICLTITSLGFSYAVFFDIDTSESEQSIVAGSLIVDYGSSSTSITDNNLVPTPDDIALNSVAQSTIYLQNNGTIDSGVVLTIGYDYDAFVNDYGESTTEKLIPLEFLNMALFEYDTVNSTNVQISEIIDLGNLPINEMDTSDFTSATHVFFKDTIEKSSSGSNAKTYVIKIWLDEFAPEYLSNYKLYLKINVLSEVKDAYTNYNINGNLKNGNNDNLAGATISLLNGSYKAVTDSSGNYSLNGLSEGIYLMNITESNGNTYQGTFELLEKDFQSLNKYNNSHVVSAGNNLTTIAYTYATTTEQLRNVNNYVRNSHEATLTNGSAVIIPNVYQIVGGSDDVISGVNIVVNNNIISSVNING